MRGYHPLYLAFFDHYHKEEYWEAHEVLEELWQSQRDNDFYHGLIQVAACMHQLRKGKIRGARKLATSAIRYLTPHAPHKDGVDLNPVLSWLEHCLERLPNDQPIVSQVELHQLQIPVCPMPQFNK